MYGVIRALYIVYEGMCMVSFVPCVLYMRDVYGVIRALCIVYEGMCMVSFVPCVQCI